MAIYWLPVSDEIHSIDKYIHRTTDSAGVSKERHDIANWVPSFLAHYKKSISVQVIRHMYTTYKYTLILIFHLEHGLTKLYDSKHAQTFWNGLDHLIFNTN